MKYLHTMLRITNPEKSLLFYCDGLGLELLERMDNQHGRFSLFFLAAPGDHSAQIELTWNWDPEILSTGRSFGHIAYRVDDIYSLCAHLQSMGYIINRPPRDGMMAFVRSPDGASIELLQKNGALPVTQPWSSMPNIGEW